jgi:tRNA nucleotidyltransferase (CCA-adding enzyme)
MNKLKTEFEELEQHLLEDEKPSLYLRDLAQNRWFMDSYPFSLLGDLKEVEQSPVHHPEGSVWEHTLMVVDLAAEGKGLSQDPRVFMWSALLHDLGKAHTTRIRRGKITAYDHDKHGAVLAAAFLKEYRFKLGGEIGVDAGVPMIDSQAISRPYLQVCKCFPRNPPASLSLHPFCVKSSI